MQLYYFRIRAKKETRWIRSTPLDPTRPTVPTKTPGSDQSLLHPKKKPPDPTKTPGSATQMLNRGKHLLSVSDVVEDGLEGFGLQHHVLDEVDVKVVKVHLA